MRVVLSETQERGRVKLSLSVSECVCVCPEFAFEFDYLIEYTHVCCAFGLVSSNRE